MNQALRTTVRHKARPTSAAVAPHLQAPDAVYPYLSRYLLRSHKIPNRAHTISSAPLLLCSIGNVPEETAQSLHRNLPTISIRKQQKAVRLHLYHNTKE